MKRTERFLFQRFINYQKKGHNVILNDSEPGVPGLSVIDQYLLTEMETARIGQGSSWAVMQSLQRLQPANLRGALKLGWAFRVLPCYIRGSGIYILTLMGLWMSSVTRNRAFLRRANSLQPRQFPERANNWELATGSIPSSWGKGLSILKRVSGQFLYLLPCISSSVFFLKVAADFLVHSYQQLLSIHCEL